MFGFSWLNSTILWIAGICLAVSIAGGFGYKVGSDHVSAQFGEFKAQVAINTANYQKQIIDLEQSNQKAIDDVKTESDKKIAVANASAAAARDAADGLRERIRKLIESSKTGSNTQFTGCGHGEQNCTAQDLLGQLLNGIIGTSTELAHYADKLKIAGMACEQSYTAIQKSHK